MSATLGADIQMQHYAFLVDDASVDVIYQRLRDRGTEHWANPQATLPGRINNKPWRPWRLLPRPGGARHGGIHAPLPAESAMAA
jgi:hypothetical protein